MEHLLSFATELARSVRGIILEMWQPEKMQINEKAPQDLVTNIDQTVDQHLSTQIKQHYPDHSLLTEEFGFVAGNEYTWIIDPIDGTTNLARGIPHFATSIAIHHYDQPLIAVIYDPIRDEMFTAMKDHGAYLNEIPLKVTACQQIKNALIATGFPVKQLQFFPAYLKCLEVTFPGSLGIRRCGASTLDQAYVAAGRLDGYWEFDIRKWDVAAGQLLVTEAGGAISDIAGGDNFPRFGIAAGTKGVQKEIVEKLKPIWDTDLKPLFEAWDFK